MALSERLAEPVQFVPVVSGRLAAADDLSTVLGPAQRRYFSWMRSARLVGCGCRSTFRRGFPMNSIWRCGCVCKWRRNSESEQQLVLALFKAYCVDDLD